MMPMQQPPIAGTDQPAAGGPPVTIDAVVALLRNDRMRGFRIDVETDSMVETDQNAEKGQRIEFVTSVGKFLTDLGPIVQAQPALAPLVGGLLQFAVRGFKVGQELEELIDKTMANISDTLQQPRPPQPDPNEQIKLAGTKMKTEAEVAKATIAAQSAQQTGQAKVESQRLDMAQTLIEHQHDNRERVMDANLALSPLGTPNGAPYV